MNSYECSLSKDFVFHEIFYKFLRVIREFLDFPHDTDAMFDIEFPIRLRLLKVRLSIIFGKMFEYFD